MKPYFLQRSSDEPGLTLRFHKVEDETRFREARAIRLDGDLLCCRGLMYDLEELLELHRQGGFQEVFTGARDLMIHAPGLELPIDWIRIEPVPENGSSQDIISSIAKGFPYLPPIIPKHVASHSFWHRLTDRV